MSQAIAKIASGASGVAGIGWRQAHYAELLEARPPLAFLEVHSENFFAAGGAAAEVLRRGREAYPISLHGVGLAPGSAAGLDEWHLQQLAALVERIDPVRVSDHACFARAPLESGGPVLHAADLLPLPFTHASLHTLVRQVQQIQERLRRPLALENLSSYLRWNQADWSEPDFFTELARRSGCHLLLDVNNLMVNALNQAGAPSEAELIERPALVAELVSECTAWLNAIGRDVTVAEIHLAGHVHADGIVIDDHGSRVAEPVWQVYRHAVRRWGRLPVLIEWDTDVPALEVLLAEAASAERQADEALSLESIQSQPAAAAEETQTKPAVSKRGVAHV